MFQKKIKIIFFYGFLFFATLNFCAFSQKKEYSGKIVDAKTFKPLSYSNVRIIGTFFGAASDVNGSFKFYGPEETVKIVASYIGYLSDTIIVSKNSKSTNLLFKLQPIEIKLKEVFVSAKYNPANDIIKKVLKRKRIREANLITYKFNIYTKGAVINHKIADTSNADKNNEEAILFFENYGYGKFKKPDRYTETILARRQTANIPATANLITGARLLTNFYEENIPFVFSNLKSPLAYDALEYYDFYLLDTLFLNDIKIFKIKFHPDNSNLPGFVGNLFVRDIDFNVARIEASINKAANIANFFEQVKIIQQFDIFNDSIFMPIDYRFYIKGNPFGLANFSLDLNSIFHNYTINDVIYDDEFGLTILRTSPDADYKDSLYWANKIFQPQSEFEIQTYKRIDSLAKIENKSFSLSDFAFNEIKIWSELSISPLANFYKFNKTEGHSLYLKSSYKKLFEERFDAEAFISYGIDDKRYKAGFFSLFKLGNYRDHFFKFNVYDNIEWLFFDDYKYSNFSSSIIALNFKKDPRNYFYSRAFELGFGAPINEYLSLQTNFISKSFYSAKTNTNYSFFYRKKFFEPNFPVQEFLSRSASLELMVDSRHIIENGRRRFRLSSGSSYFYAIMKAEFFDKDFLKSEKHFELFKFKFIYSRFYGNGVETSLFFDSYFSFSNLPEQYYSSLPGIYNALGKDYTFRNLRFAEYVGSTILQSHLNINFKDKLFKNKFFPYLSFTDLFFSAGASIGYAKFSRQEAKRAAMFNFVNRNKPYAESGFAIWHPLFPIKIEFFWTVLGNSRTRFSINLNSNIY